MEGNLHPLCYSWQGLDQAELRGPQLHAHLPYGWRGEQVFGWSCALWVQWVEAALKVQRVGLNTSTLIQVADCTSSCLSLATTTPTLCKT